MFIALLIYAPIFLISSVHTEGDDSSLEAKIGLIEQQINGAASETTSALDSNAYRVAAQQEIALRTTLGNLLRNKLSRTRRFNSGQDTRCN